MKCKSWPLRAGAAALLALSLFPAFAGCDITLFGPPPPPGAAAPYVPASDASPMSIAGERYEKYVARMDPAILNKVVGPMSSPRVLAGRWAPPGEWIEFYNYASLDRVSLRALVEGGAYTAQVSGNAVASRYWPNPSDTYREYLDTQFSRSVALQFNASNTRPSPQYERKSVPTSFASDSLVLPETGGYSLAYDESQAYNEYRYRTFLHTVTKDQIDAWAWGSARPDYPFTANLTLEIQTFERYTWASRNFYQYKNFSVSYDPDVFLFSVHPVYPEPIVQSFYLDTDTNTLRVELRDYDEPYAGRIISYWIQAEDGTVREKIISIGDLEN
jgi:hypothetical protein